MKKLTAITIASILLASCTMIKKIGNNMNSNYTQKSQGQQQKASY